MSLSELPLYRHWLSFIAYLENNSINSMSGNENRFASPEFNANIESRWKVSPREFIFKYIYILPWVLASAIIFFISAYLKVRYTTPIFEVRSALLIKSDQDNSIGDKDQKFQQLFMAQGNVNLSNEIEILKSRPVLGRVAKDLQLQNLCYGKGKVRSSLMYPEKPFSLEFLSRTDSCRGFQWRVVIVSSAQCM